MGCFEGVDGRDTAILIYIYFYMYLYVSKVSLNCSNEKHQVFLVRNLFKILLSWYIPLVKNKNTMFILAAFASNKLILMSLLLCKQNGECSARFQRHTYCHEAFAATE